jgi:hypothetical protein
VEQKFLEPKLNGERFDRHTVPLELLKDFSALQDMLVEVAKWEFRNNHPDRERIPRNFTDGVDLHLTSVDEGSAKLVICLVFAGLFPTSSHLNYFEKAKSDIIEAIASAEKNSIPFLPPYLLSYFDRFGRGLRQGESISFERAGGHATLTPESRKQLMHYSQVKEWTEKAAIRVRISEVDKRKNSFQMELSDGTRFPGVLNELYHAAILEAFGNYKNGHDEYLLVQGIVKKDREDHLKSIESIDHVTPLEPLDIFLRLDELAKLDDGWLDGKGRAAEKEKLEWLGNAFDSFFDTDLPLPYLYPTAEGGIQAEWSLSGWEVSLEIDLDKQTGEYQALNVMEDKATELTFSLDNHEGWSKLNDVLKQLEKKQVEEQPSGL